MKLNDSEAVLAFQTTIHKNKLNLSNKFKEFKFWTHGALDTFKADYKKT